MAQLPEGPLRHEAEEAARSRDGKRASGLLAELGIRTETEFRDILTLGGFPEPYLSGSETETRRWAREHRNLLIREEVVSLERVQDLGHLELLILRLPELVGSPLSLNAVREDLQVSHKTVATWLQILERLYAISRLSPLGAPLIRALKKAQKHYHHEQDVNGRDLELRYFRDVDGREVDFVVTDRHKPILLVESKWSDMNLDPGLRYLKARFPSADAWQISAAGKKDYVTPEGIRVAPALKLLSTLI